MNENKTIVKLNEYITIVVSIPQETDIATFEGIVEFIRKIRKSTGVLGVSVAGTSHRKSSKSKWTLEKAKMYIADKKVLTNNDMIKKYGLPDSKKVSHMNWYLHKKFGKELEE